jgi:urease accessory protein
VSEFLAWQVVDSAFPTGLFAHSGGLESAWHHGEVAGARSLGEFVEASVLQTGYAVLPFVNAAFGSSSDLESLDALADAFLTNPVANRASRIQGRTLVATAGRVWPSPALAALAARVAATCAHAAPVAGVTIHAVGLALPTVQRLVLYGAARASSRLPCASASSAATRRSGCRPRASRVCGAWRRGAAS